MCKRSLNRRAVSIMPAGSSHSFIMQAGITPARILTYMKLSYPYLTSIVSTAMMSSTVTPNIAAKITMLSIVGIAVPWIHL